MPAYRTESARTAHPLNGGEAWGSPWFPHGPPPCARRLSSTADVAGFWLAPSAVLLVWEPPAGRSPAPAAARCRFRATSEQLSCRGPLLECRDAPAHHPARRP